MFKNKIKDWPLTKFIKSAVKTTAQSLGGPIAPLVTALTTNDGGTPEGKINWKSPELWARIGLGALAAYLMYKGAQMSDIKEIIEAVANFF